MKKKIKIFGIGAAIILVMLAITPAVVSTGFKPLPPPLGAQLSQFMTQYEVELNELDQYLETLTDADIPQQIPPEIKGTMRTLQKAMYLILRPYIVDEETARYTGWNSYWKSDGLGLFVEGSDWHYQGYCFSADRLSTDILITLILLEGGTAAVLVAVFLALIPIIGFIVGVILAIAVLASWDEILDFLSGLYSSNQYGLVLCLFDPAEAIFQYSSDDHDQPSDPYWTPELWHNETTWSRLWPPYECPTPP